MKKPKGGLEALAGEEVPRLPAKASSPASVPGRTGGFSR
jgi:hypothetical protein